MITTCNKNGVRKSSEHGLVKKTKNLCFHVKKHDLCFLGKNQKKNRWQDCWYAKEEISVLQDVTKFLPFEDNGTKKIKTGGHRIEESIGI